MDKAKEKERLLKRTKKKDKKAPLSNYKRYQRLFRDYIFEDDNDEHDQYKCIKESLGNINKIASYLHTLENSYSKPRKLPKWTKELKPKKGQQRKKVSPLFDDMYEEFWNATLTRKETLEITKSMKLCYDDLGVDLVVLSIPNIEDLALKYNVTIDNIRKVINRWTYDDAPFIKLRMTKPKNEGGTYIYGIGFWTEYARVSFFTKERYEKWLRGVMFR